MGLQLWGQWKEGNDLINDSLNTFYLWTYGKGPLRYRERTPAAATWATLSNYQQGFFYMHHPTDRIAHSTAFVTPVVGHWLEREIAQGVDHEGSIRRPIAPWADALTTELHVAARVKGTGEGAGIMFGSFSSTHCLILFLVSY